MIGTKETRGSKFETLKKFLERFLEFWKIFFFSFRTTRKKPVGMSIVFGTPKTATLWITALQIAHKYPIGTAFLIMTPQATAQIATHIQVACSPNSCASPRIEPPDSSALVTIKQPGNLCCWRYFCDIPRFSVEIDWLSNQFYDQNPNHKPNNFHTLAHTYDDYFKSHVYVIWFVYFLSVKSISRYHLV